jgi:hypothetical protein
MDTGTAISLVDNTVPSQQSSDETSRTSSVSRPAPVARLFTRGSIRSEIAKRKYAKWQPERLGAMDNNNANRRLSRSPAPSAAASRDVARSRSRESSNLQHLQHLSSETADVAHSPTQDDNHTQDSPERASSDAELLKELDVLYENQRGWFFSGIPFYSRRSLLQFDPPAWVNHEFKESPVDVRNAQVPDPSWAWVWKTWYVDMSDDVDEEGWQYSLSFGSRFGWHGTHPWFHSYVRRRRWIRLRMKLYGMEQANVDVAHALNEDYFTIHSKEARRRESSIYLESARRSTYRIRMGTEYLEEVSLEDIKDIPTLMWALKISVVDRERIEVLKKFVEQGGDELRYLEEKVCLLCQ